MTVWAMARLVLQRRRRSAPRPQRARATSAPPRTPTAVPSCAPSRLVVGRAEASQLEQAKRSQGGKGKAAAAGRTRRSVSTSLRKKLLSFVSPAGVLSLWVPDFPCYVPGSVRAVLQDTRGEVSSFTRRPRRRHRLALSLRHRAWHRSHRRQVPRASRTPAAKPCVARPARHPPFVYVALSRFSLTHSKVPFAAAAAAALHARRCELRPRSVTQQHTHTAAPAPVPPLPPIPPRSPPRPQPPPPAP